MRTDKTCGHCGHVVQDLNKHQQTPNCVAKQNLAREEADGWQADYSRCSNSCIHRGYKPKTRYNGPGWGRRGRFADTYMVRATHYIILKSTSLTEQEKHETCYLDTTNERYMSLLVLAELTHHG